jgi:anti-sigma regulatory factor (Ser/Thr protein kinase)
MPSTIPVPDARMLGGTVRDVERFYTLLDQLSPAGQSILDMAEVDFIRSYGAIAMIGVARLLAKRSGNPLILINLRPKVHAYLHYMRVFDVGADFIQAAETLPAPWQPASNTPDQLQLTPVKDAASVGAIVTSARHIYGHWLRASNYGHLLTVISELCANIYQHSGDPQGYVLIQKVQSRTRGRVEVRLAVGDLGIGIRGSLSVQHGDIGDNPLDYLKAAMQGKTARPTGRGGTGLRRVEQFVEAVGGYLWLRSETAAILSSGPEKAEYFNDLICIPGTQVAVELHAPLQD